MCRQVAFSCLAEFGRFVFVRLARLISFVHQQLLVGDEIQDQSFVEVIRRRQSLEQLLRVPAKCSQFPLSLGNRVIRIRSDLLMTRTASAAVATMIDGGSTPSRLAMIELVTWSYSAPRSRGRMPSPAAIDKTKSVRELAGESSSHSGEPR